MPQDLITILTGNTGSGKTTYLQNHFASEQNYYGILTPVKNGERFFLDIETGEQFSMQASPGEKEILLVGRFQFSKEAFAKASAIITNALQKQNGTIILDEIGPLELRREGFYNVAEGIIQHTNPQLDKLIVVRETILQEVIQFFSIENYKITTVPSF